MSRVSPTPDLRDCLDALDSAALLLDAAAGRAGRRVAPRRPVAPTLVTACIDLTLGRMTLVLDALEARR